MKAFFFLESTCACVLDPWPRAFLSLASRVSVLGKAVLGLGLGFFLCPWPWPRALCPRLHLWYLHSVLSMVFGLIISIPPITITNTHLCNQFSIAIISPLIIAITTTSLRQTLTIIFVTALTKSESILHFCFNLPSNSVLHNQYY